MNSNEIEVGDTFTHGGITYTRLPNSTNPFWPGEPFVIHTHPKPSIGVQAQTFEQGPLWFEARGLKVAQ
jgi:hypothetical protein